MKTDATRSFETSRLTELITALEKMAGGEMETMAPVSSQRDELDALAYGINVLAGELLYRLRELRETQAGMLHSGKLAALGEVCSGLAHELNTPLASIRGYTELILESLESGPCAAIPPEVPQYLGRIDDNIERMSLIIDYIKDFSRQSPQKLERVSIQKVIERSFILFNQQFRLLNIQVERSGIPEKAWVVGDSLRLEQVMVNLLNNARDAIGKDGGRISIETAVTGSEVVISIADDGIGMKEEVREKIFQPFFTTKEVGKGTGLGLSICLGIIQEHGGRIDCSSALGSGSRFTLRLPRAPGEA